MRLEVAVDPGYFADPDGELTLALRGSAERERGGAGGGWPGDLLFARSPDTLQAEPPDRGLHVFERVPPQGALRRRPATRGRAWTCGVLAVLAGCAGKASDTGGPPESGGPPTVDSASGSDTEDTACDQVLRYEDADGDGFGVVEVLACAGADGTASNPGDCDDSNPHIHPGAPESCDGVDEDCDGSVDDEPVVAWMDDDGDGFGLAPAACPPPPGSTAVDGDCDDEDPAVHPGAPDVCNAVDDDCDGLVDEGSDPPAAVLDGMSSDCDDRGERADLSEAAEARLLGRLDPNDDLGGGLEVADVNDDGFPDILVGSMVSVVPLGASGPRTGVVYVFLGPFGPGDLHAEDAAFIVYGGGDSWVEDVALAGDVTGDGVSDFVISGVNAHSGGEWDIPDGGAYLAPGPLVEDADLGTFGLYYDRPPWGTNLLGASVQPGDLDGDGLADVVLGTQDPDEHGERESAAYVLPGPAAYSLNEAPTVYHADEGENAGITGTGLGDVTGDGQPDLALLRHGPGPHYGDFFVLVTEPHVGTLDWRDAGPLYAWFDAPDDPYLQPGFTIRNVGDVTGDGVDDVALPSYIYGYTHIMAGPLPEDRDYDVVEEAVAVLEDPTAWEPGVWNVESRGDTDGEGTSDLVIAAPRYTRVEDWYECEWGGDCGQGALYVINGPFEGYVDMSTRADLIIGENDWAELGTELAAGEDLNGDGATDIIATSPSPTLPDGDEEDGGVAYLLFGPP